MTLLNSAFIPESIDLGTAFSFFENRHFADTLVNKTPTYRKINNMVFSTPNYTDSPLADDFPTEILTSTPDFSRFKSKNNTPASSAAHRRLREQFRKNKLMSSPSIVSPKSENHKLSSSLSSNNINNIPVTPKFDFQETLSFRPKPLDLFARGILCFKLVNLLFSFLNNFRTAWMNV